MVAGPKSVQRTTAPRFDEAPQSLHVGVAPRAAGTEVHDLRPNLSCREIDGRHGGASIPLRVTQGARKGDRVQPLIPWFEVLIFELPFEFNGSYVSLHGFGILVALGFVFGGSAAIQRADRMGLKGEAINRLITYLVVGTFVGGHVGYGLMYQPADYLAHPEKFLFVWQGLSSFGGFLVCVPLAIWFFRREKLHVWSYLDCLAVGMALGWFLGRMGCFVAHDHPGSETDFFLGVYCRPVEGHVLDLPAFMVLGDGSTMDPWGPCLTQPSINAVHDTGLYEALWSLTMFGVFRLMDTRAWKPGTFTLTLGLSYGPVRFILDSLRPESSDPLYAGLTPAQWLSLTLTLVCLGALYWRSQSDEEMIGPPKAVES